MFQWFPENGTVKSIMEPFTEFGENRDEVDKSDKSDNSDINIITTLPSVRRKRQALSLPLESKLRIKVGTYHSKIFREP